MEIPMYGPHLLLSERLDWGAPQLWQASPAQAPGTDCSASSSPAKRFWPELGLAAALMEAAVSREPLVSLKSG